MVIVSHDDSNDKDDDKKEVSCTCHDAKDLHIDIPGIPPRKGSFVLQIHYFASNTVEYEHYEQQRLLKNLYLIAM